MNFNIMYAWRLCIEACEYIHYFGHMYYCSVLLFVYDCLLFVHVPFETF